eukprot:360643-Chlamydomonas_euryale.AAC.15
MGKDGTFQQPMRGQQVEGSGWPLLLLAHLPVAAPHLASYSPRDELTPVLAVALQPFFQPPPTSSPLAAVPLPYFSTSSNLLPPGCRASTLFFNLLQPRPSWLPRLHPIFQPSSTSSLLLPRLHPFSTFFNLHLYLSASLGSPNQTLVTTPQSLSLTRVSPPLTW